MRTLALQPSQEATRVAKPVEAPPRAVLAQRKSSFGSPCSVTAPPIVDGGRGIDASARGMMESGFGRPLGHVRVHDDARAHEDARSLGARAYAAGDHIVFGEGQYRPETAAGRALIAHEIAHVVQQGGVQRKPDGPLPASADAGLEAEADRAALAVTAGERAPTLRRIDAPAVFRNGTNTPAPAAATTPATAATPGVVATPNAAVGTATAAGPAVKLPAGMTVITDEPAGLGTTELVVRVTNFSLPVEKGMGPWVQKAYNEAAAGGRLVFSPLIEGGRVAAYKEGGEDYKSIWLGNFGFSTTADVAKAFQTAAATEPDVKAAAADKDVAKLVTGLSNSLQKSGCDIDHIVEKQIGGTSIPSNLQILLSGKNQDSGRKTYQALVALVEQIRDPSMRGTGVKRLQLVLQAAAVPAGTSDASYLLENLLRNNRFKGSDAVKALAGGKPVSLSAGGVGETVSVRDTGRSSLDSMSKRIVPGMRLTTYVRGPQGAKSKVDHVEAELDSRALKPTKTKANKAGVVLTAELPAAGAPAPTPIGAAAGGAAAEANAEVATAGGEIRTLKLDPKTKQDISFYYPYLSPGVLTSARLDDQGDMVSDGVLDSSVPILGKLQIHYEKETLSVVAPIPADKLKSPIPMLRFTGGALELQLTPTLVPKGRLDFEIGPKGKPVVKGDLTAKVEGGAFVATGSLVPADKVPGITAAKGEVTYHSENGWSGKLTASSSTIKNAHIDVELGFTSGKGGFSVYGKGGIKTQIKDAVLSLGVAWNGGALAYSGRVTVPKPLPLVDQVTLEGRYANDLLSLDGDAEITWKSIKATMHVAYRRKDGEEGKFSGKADVKIETAKASGSISLSFDEAGNYWGSGSLSYQVTKDIRPKLGVELTKDRRIKVLGEVALADIALTKMWPAPDGGKITIIKGLGVKFNIPTPVPGITAFAEIRGSLGLGYGVGPIMLKGVKFNGELYPLEPDPKVKAKLTGKFAVPAYGEIYGTFGAYIGVEVLLGAAGAKGGIDVTPKLRISGEGGIDINADYDSAGFSFSAEAYALGKLTASVDVDLKAEIYAVWGLFSHTWTYNVARVSKQIGPELKLTLGKIAYSKSGEITWPSLSQIKAEPDTIDPLEVVKELMGKGEAKEVAGGSPPPRLERMNYGSKI